MVVSHLTNFDIGRPSVFLFFALSGYWVGRMYDEKYRKYGSISVFYLSRFLRIWLSFAAALALTASAFSLLDKILSWEMLSNLLLFGIATTNIDLLGTAWSLDIEMQFYLSLPLIWMIAERRISLLALAGLVLLLTLFGWLIAAQTGLKTLLMYLPSFVIGITIYRTRWQPSERELSAYFGLFIAATLMILLVPTLKPFLFKNQPNPFDRDIFGQVWILTLIPLIAWNVRQPSGKLDRHFGNISYVVYIIHYPIIEVGHELLQKSGLGGKLGAILIIASASIVFYLTIDRPSERFRGRIVRKYLSGVQARSVVEESPPF